MTIDGINILTTYNLRLETVKENLSLPARKRILQEPAFTSNDIKLEAREYRVSIFGEYSNKTQVASVANLIRTLITSTVKHQITIPTHQISITGVFKSGAKVETYGNILLITFAIIETDD